MTGFEVVETHHVLSQKQQRFDQVRTDESRAACDEPAQGLGPKLGDRGAQSDRFARDAHQSLQTCMPRARSAAPSARLFTST